jgi:hypothetical protein
MAARHRRILNLMTATKGHSLNLMTATHDQILTDDGNTGESESAAYDYEYESESDDSGEDDMSTLRERAEEQWTWKLEEEPYVDSMRHWCRSLPRKTRVLCHFRSGGTPR